jgi:hypothetical protein
MQKLKDSACSFALGAGIFAFLRLNYFGLLGWWWSNLIG